MPSLCEGWSSAMLWRISCIRSRCRWLGLEVPPGGLLPDRVNAVGVAVLRDREPRELVDLVRRYALPSGQTAGFGGKIALTDGLIHHQDIRRPLGLAREVPTDRLRVALPSL